MTLEPGHWNVRKEDNKVTLQIENLYRGKTGFDYRTNIEYTVAADGSILVNSTIIPSTKGVIIPRIGYRMELPEGFERMRWYGRGPLENYVDRKDATYVGVYDELVSDQWVNYVRAQEMGNREDLRWISITNPDGIGFVFIAGDKMSASALHATAQDMVDPANHRRLLHKYRCVKKLFFVWMLISVRLVMPVVVLARCKSMNFVPSLLFSVLSYYLWREVIRQKNL